MFVLEKKFSVLLDCVNKIIISFIGLIGNKILYRVFSRNEITQQREWQTPKLQQDCNDWGMSYMCKKWMIILQAQSSRFSTFQTLVLLINID